MAAPNLRRRASTPELMDGDAVEFEEFRTCLENLETINRLSLTYQPILGFLDRLRRHNLLPEGRPLVVLDVGSGYGGLLRRIDQWAERRHIEVRLIGLDKSPFSAEAAVDATEPNRPIEWVTADLFEYQPDTEIDIIVSSQFAHHLDDIGLVRFLRWMEQTAKIGWVIGDLHRHGLAYHLFKLWAAIARFNRLVRHDGPVSIARGFRHREWVRLLVAARISETGTEITWKFPFRWAVTRIHRA